MSPRPGTPAISVAVCTRNRSQVLGGCLASLATQDLSAIEVIVVDNGSSDATDQVVRAWQSRVTGLEYLREPVPGLSRARNLALGRARGEIVAFIDDDARATPSWLSALRGAFSDGRVAAAGGPVTLSWPAGRPPWVSPAMERWFSAVDLGSSFHQLDADEELFGCNLSIRREVASAVGGFDPALGRIGRRLRSGEDWDLVQRVRQAGGAVVYVPDAVVVHEVLPERTRLTWPLRRAYEQGRSDAFRTHGDDHTSALRAEARAAMARATQGASRELRAWTTGRRPARTVVEALMGRALQVGYAYECGVLAIRAARPQGRR